MTASRKQALGECSCARANKRGKEACELMGNVTSKSIDRFKHRIRDIIGRSRVISMERRLRKIARFVLGWMGYFAIVSQLKLLANLEQSLCLFLQKARGRLIGSCNWKRWRHVHTRIRNLLANEQRLVKTSDPARQKSYRSLAHGHDDCEWRWYDQCLVS